MAKSTQVTIKMSPNEARMLAAELVEWGEHLNANASSATAVARSVMVHDLAERATAAVAVFFS